MPIKTTRIEQTFSFGEASENEVIISRNEKGEVIQLCLYDRDKQLSMLLDELESSELIQILTTKLS